MAKGKSKAAAKANGASVPTVSYEAATVKIHVRDAGFNRDQSRNLTRPEGGRDITTLAAQIKAQGQTQPVIVTRNGEGFDLQAGFGRTAAIDWLFERGEHDGHVEARVQVQTDALSIALANVCENEDGKQEITWLGRLAGFEALVAQGLTIEQVAQTVGRAEDVVRDTLRITKGHALCRAALEADAKGEPVTVEADGETVEQGPVAWGTVRHVLKFPKKEQPELLRRVAGLSCEKARQLLQKIKNGEDAPAPVEPGEGEGEGGGEGEGEGPGRTDGDNGLDEFRATVAEVMTPALLSIGDRAIELQSALAAGDIDAATVLGRKIIELVSASGKALIGLAGEGNVEAAKHEYKRVTSEQRVAAKRR